MGLIAPSATLMARARPFFTSSCRAMNSGIAAQQNIGAAAGHVGGDGDRAQPPGLRHNLRFALVKLGVEHHVLHALALQNGRQPLRSFRSTRCPPAPAAASHAAAQCRRRRPCTSPSPCGRPRRDFPAAASACWWESQRSQACRSFQTRPLRSRPCPSCRSAFDKGGSNSGR